MLDPVLVSEIVSLCKLVKSCVGISRTEKRRHLQVGCTNWGRWHLKKYFTFGFVCICVAGALTPGVKRPGREADHSPPCSAEVKKERSYTSAPPYVFMAWCLVKHRDNFTFSFSSMTPDTVTYETSCSGTYCRTCVYIVTRR